MCTIWPSGWLLFVLVSFALFVLFCFLFLFLKTYFLLLFHVKSIFSSFPWMKASIRVINGHLYNPTPQKWCIHSNVTKLWCWALCLWWQQSKLLKFAINVETNTITRIRDRFWEVSIIRYIAHNLQDSVCFWQWRRHPKLTCKYIRSKNQYWCFGQIIGPWFGQI